tara:strand:- start:979 stop:1704 length:726 start_codon:yes stop_codon:yes gene_type:complete
MNISIIIPIYKEDDNILELITKIDHNLKINNHHYMIILVDDSPTNSTENIIKKYEEKVKLIYRGKKLGRGSAVLEGIKAALNSNLTDLIIEMDADFSHDPSEINENVEIFVKNNCDLLVASRYLNKSKIINWPISRKILSLMSNKLAKFFLKIPISDYTNGFRFYSKDAAKHISLNCGKIGDGFIVLSEILLELHTNNFRLFETETVFKNRIKGTSSVNIILLLNSLLGLFKLFLKKLKKK